jgi:hypothetical protein
MVKVLSNIVRAQLTGDYPASVFSAYIQLLGHIIYLADHLFGRIVAKHSCHDWIDFKQVTVKRRPEDPQR